MNETVDRASAAAGCVLAGVAVALGAWAAHGLDAVLTPKYAGQTHEVAGVATPSAVKYLADFRTGVTYQMWTGLAVLATAAWAGKAAAAGRWLLVAGAAVFSGSLYALVLSGVRWLGAITPIGGVLMLAGWATLAAAALRGQPVD